MKKILLFISLALSFGLQNASAQSSELDPEFLTSRVTIESAPVMVFDANENLIDQTSGKLRIWTDFSNTPASIVFVLENLNSSKADKIYMHFYDSSCKATRRGDIDKGDDVLEFSKQLPDGHQTLTGMVSSPVEGAPSDCLGQIYFALVDPQGNIEKQVVVALTWNQYLHAMLYSMTEVKNKGIVPLTLCY